VGISHQDGLDAVSFSASYFCLTVFICHLICGYLVVFIKKYCLNTIFMGVDVGLVLSHKDSGESALKLLGSVQ